MSAGATSAEGATSDAKRFASLQAKAALRGIAVTPTTDDRGRTVWIVSQWSLCRQCDTLDELHELLVRMGARP